MGFALNSIHSYLQLGTKYMRRFVFSLNQIWKKNLGFIYTFWAWIGDSVSGRTSFPSSLICIYPLLRVKIACF